MPRPGQLRPVHQRDPTLMPRAPFKAPVHLNALRAFEAAARHSSFAAAAEELHVTPSAVSQQVRALEDYLGIALFTRSGGSIAMTAQARASYPDIRQGLARLSLGLETMRNTWREQAVTLSVPSSFASKWLLPRIDRFRQAYPDLDLRLDTTDRLADYAAEGIDLGVRYGRGGYAGLDGEQLLGEEVSPVCSPRLLPLPAGWPDAARAFDVVLIHDTTIDFEPAFPTWRSWFSARGMTAPDSTRNLHFNSTVLAIQAAIDGHGLLLGRSVAVAGDLEAGRLVRPFADALPTGCAYFVLHVPGALERAPVRAVRDWLFAEASTRSA